MSLRMLLLVFALCSGFDGVAESSFFETLPNGERPASVAGETAWETNFVGAVRQAAGALTNRIIFTTGGHGWTWSSRKGWYTQRGVSNEMNEDYGNLDQQNSFVPYVFNAGATVVAFRPIGQQTNEVVLDNTSRGVSFDGTWFNTHSDIYYGEAGALPYRFSPLGTAETATATYTPKIPATGFYPVYTWVRHGADRTSQLYRILHTGGQTLIRVPHHMVGNGWVYLGTYYFEEGNSRNKGSVVISNLQPSPGFGSVAIADAIRFGNGMGDIAPEGGTISGYPREEEAARYWIERSFGQGQTNFLAGDLRDHQIRNVGAPIRMAREMNREEEGNMFQRLYLGFHSNAGGGRGVVGLWNNPELFPGSKTPNQQRWAELLGREVNDTLSAITSPPLEVPWFPRTRYIYARNDYPFGELNDHYIGGEFDATILEVAFHDSKDDAKLLRDPKVRDVLSRCSYQAAVHYMHEFDDVPLAFLPHPPQNPRARSTALGISVGWDRPADVRTNAPDYYLVYRSDDGYGFGDPVRVAATKSFTRFEDLPANKPFYFRITAVNQGGESLPSAVVGVRQPTQLDIAPVLFVNGFTQLDRVNIARQTIEATNFVPLSAYGDMERTITRLNNAFDYVVQHGQALSRHGKAFDSCQREAISSGFIELTNYSVVVWAAGRQQTNLFTASEIRALSEYVAGGGHVFLSGAYLGEALAQIDTTLRSPFIEITACGACPITSTTKGEAAPLRGSIFRRNRPLYFGNGTGNSYFLATSSTLTPAGNAIPCLEYAEGTQVAALQYEHPTSKGKIVCFGFPFETISSARSRAEYMADILEYFDQRPKPRFIAPRLAALDVEVE